MGQNIQPKHTVKNRTHLRSTGKPDQKSGTETYVQHNQRQVEKGKIHREKVLVLGDFNCKIGTDVKGNTETETKGGKTVKRPGGKDQHGNPQQNRTMHWNVD